MKKFDILRLLLVALAVTAIAVFLVPADLIRQHAVLIEPDRTRRAIDPVYIRGAALAVAGVTLLTVALMTIGRARLEPRVERLWLAARAALPSAWDRSAFRDPLARHHVGILALITGLGLALRTRLVLTRAVGPDESINFIFFVSRSLLDVLSDYHIPNNHVLHTVFVHLSYSLFGQDLVFLRLPALIAGLLCIPAAFWLGGRLFDSGTGLAAAAIVAVGPPLVEYSADARGYTLLALFVVTAFIAATYLRERPNPLAWTAFVLASVLGIYTLPIGLYGTAAISLWLLFGRWERGHVDLVRKLAVAGVAIFLLSAVLYAPIIVRSGLHSLLEHDSARAMPFPRVLSHIPLLAKAILQCWTAPLPLALGTILFLGPFIGTLVGRRNAAEAGRILLAVLLAVAPMFLIQRLTPQPRAFHFWFPVFAILVGHGYRSLTARLLSARTGPRRGWSAAILVVCAAWGIAVWRSDRFWCAERPFADAEAIARDFATRLEPETVLVAHLYAGIVQPTRYYLMGLDVSPRRFHGYAPRRSRNQLDPYRRILVVTRECPESLRELGFSEAVIREEFLEPRLLRSYSESCVYLIERRPDRPLEPTPYPEDPWGFAALW